MNRYHDRMQEIDRDYRRAIWLGLILGMVSLIAALSFCDVQWSRLNGRVKGINGKMQQVTIQNKEGDLLTVKVDDDVSVVRKKEVVKLKDIEIDDRVTLINIPQGPKPKETEDVPEGGFYPPLKR